MSPSNMITLPTIGVAGLFRVQVRRHGLLRHDTGWFDNLLLNGGLEAMGGSLPVARYCQVGTGNTAPTVNNVTLDSSLAFADYATNGTGDSQGIVTTGARHGWSRRNFAFDQGAVIGNIAEVGVGWMSGLGTPLLSRSLVTPAISLIAIDQLTVTYELRMYLPTVDVTGGPLIIGAGSYNFTVRPLNASNNTNAGSQGAGWCPKFLGLPPAPWVDTGGSVFKGTIGYKAPCILTPIDNSSVETTPGVPATDSSQTLAAVNSAYTANSKQANFSNKFGITMGNFVEGMQGFLFTGAFGTYQCILDAPVVKNDTQELTMNWRQSWVRRP